MSWLDADREASYHRRVRSQLTRKGTYLVFLLLAGLSSGVSQAIGITPLIGYGLGNALVGGNVTYTASVHPPAIGGGAVVEFNISRKLKIETGGIYMVRGFVESTSPSTTIGFKTLQFPLMLRVYLLPGISVGAGAYFSYALGSISSNSDGIPYNQLSYATNDYGATASFGLRFGLAKSAGLIVQVRGLYGFPNIAQAPGVTTTLYDIQTFAGIKFGE